MVGTQYRVGTQLNNNTSYFQFFHSNSYTFKAGHRYEFFMKPQVPESTQKEAGNVKIDILDITHLQHLPGVESLIQKANPVYAFEESVSELVEAGADITFTFSL
ncbi:expressed unknown protein [Seminavis robusta]|uniref:Uncharacterized protein n=1 Tax=Seminavis robusta TaxID=568900 RepID=A0A9N8EE59_9STRA|nr:expressed unknown protein [Seminavis robusta]|eukprot:Sro945_g223070.1 n/a (104) ;mRNA; r:5579-5980